MQTVLGVYRGDVQIGLYSLLGKADCYLTKSKGDQISLRKAVNSPYDLTYCLRVMVDKLDLRLMCGCND